FGMSQTIPISSASKKRLDEKNGKLVKELSLQLENRNCVECGMRGPTYVDMTTTSFCCATCAGVLRGVNPPHRIKSISMATFSCEEVDTLKNGGNEQNRRTWMGLHTGPQVTNFASKEERTKFITDKYESKKWYVSAEEVANQKELLDRAVEAKSEQLKMSSPRHDPMDVFSSVSLGGMQSARPPPSVSLDSVFAPPSMLGGTPLDRMVRLDEPHPFSPPAFMAPPPPLPAGAVHPSTLPISQQPTHMPINFAFGSPPTGLPPQSRYPAAVSSTPAASAAAAAVSPVDPFSPLSALAKPFPKDSSQPAIAPTSSFLPKPSFDPFGSDPFGPSTNAGGAAGDPFGASSFSGFAVKFDDETPTKAAPRGSNPFDAFGMGTTNNGAVPPPAVVPPPSSDPFASLTAFPSATPAAAAAAPLPAALPIPAASQMAVNTMTVPTPSPALSSVSPSRPPVQLNTDADKYSALAELDELFHSSTISDSSNGAKPSWVSSGFSAPPPSTASAFPNGMAKSSTMGAISSSTMTSSIPFGANPSTVGSNWSMNPVPVPSFPQPNLGFASQSSLSGSSQFGVAPMQNNFPSLNMQPGQQQSQYAQAAAMTGNPFAAFSNQQAGQQPSNGGHQSNPSWNPFL
ncbi:hypothetical protein PFISCL1PPCAC_24162, partial [Pristionchus fissidentatus]